MKSTAIGLLMVALLPVASFARSDGSLVIVPDVCRVYDVRFKVTVDRLTVNDIGILFDDGDVQYIPVHQHYPRDTGSEWFQIDSYRRCIRGFSVNGKGDLDLQNARVTIIGYQRYGRGRNVVIGSTVIRDF